MRGRLCHAHSAAYPRAMCSRGIFCPTQAKQSAAAAFRARRSPILQPPSNKAYHAPAEHLPWRPRPLPEYKIGNERRERARHKARLRPERDGCDYNNCRHGLEIGQRYKLKHRPPHNAKRRHDRQRHHFPRARLPALKFKKERHAARKRNTSPIIMSEFITIESQRLSSPYGLIVALVA